VQELEGVGARWTGGAGQVECGRFAWFSSPSLPSDRNLKRLAEIKSDITAIKIEAVKCGRSAGVERLDHILNTIDFLASYDRAALLYRSGGPVEKALAAGRTDEALRALHESHLPEAMHAYARKISTRSELGVLATMNVKAYAAYRKLLERAGGDKDAAWEAKPGPPLLIIPVHNTTYDVGEPAVVKAIAMDDKGIQGVRVHCRRLGQTAFTRVEMENYFRDSYRAALPGMTDGPGAFEFYVEAVDDYGGRTVSPHGAPEALYSAVVRPARAGAGSTRQLSPDLVDAILQPAELSRLFESASAGGPAPELARVDDVTAKTEPGGIRLQWRAVEGAAGYHVYRTARGENRPSNLTAAFPVAETAFLDADVEVGAAYSYVVRAVGHGLVEGPPSVAVSCTAAYHPPAGVKLAVGDKPLLDVRCAIRGPAGRIDDFNSFDRDKVVLRRQPISVRKLKGFGYCWQAGDCGCWAGGDSVSFRLEGLTAQGHYVLWLRCLSWDGYERTVSVSVSGDEAVREWKLPAGRDAQAGWRPIGFSAGGEQAVVVVRRLSGINAVVSQIVLVETRM